MVFDPNKKKALDPAPVTKPKEDVKKKPVAPDLKKMDFQEQQALLKPNAKAPKGTQQSQEDLAAKQAPPPAVLDQLKKILADAGIPACVLPRNVQSFHHDPSSGALQLTLASGFTKEIVDDKGQKNLVKFDQVLTMKVGGKALSDIKGITVPSSHGARLTEIEVVGGGYIRLTGRVGFISKSLDIREADFPALP
jgi:hypothetical protein